MPNLHDSEHWFLRWFTDHCAGFDCLRATDFTGERGRATGRRWFAYFFRGSPPLNPTLAELQAASNALQDAPPRKAEDHTLAIRREIEARRQTTAKGQPRSRSEIEAERSAAFTLFEKARYAFDESDEDERELMLEAERRECPGAANERWYRRMAIRRIEEAMRANPDFRPEPTQRAARSEQTQFDVRPRQVLTVDEAAIPF